MFFGMSSTDRYYYVSRAEPAPLQTTARLQWQRAVFLSCYVDVSGIERRDLLRALRS